MENTCFWQRSLTAKQLLHGAKERKTTKKLTLTPLLGGFSWDGRWALADIPGNHRPRDEIFENNLEVLNGVGVHGVGGIFPFFSFFFFFVFLRFLIFFRFFLFFFVFLRFSSLFFVFLRF